jgi:hypothetical protein
MNTEIYVINPSTQTVERQPLTTGLDEIKSLIGFDSLETDPIDNQGHVLYFDENCFIRDSKHLGRFQIDTLAPVAGVGVVVCQRTSEAGSLSLETPSLSLEALKARVKFISSPA